ncbi:MAG TPA: RHS repeat-associated core domain-containing protein, partial [Pirellulales bacterium]|nr:RHS repeat-associated core domain-containing protein [Pirellulales bacterium]
LTEFIQFRDDIAVDPNQTYQIVTSYSYTFFPGTLKVQSITTTWPVVSTDQNGSGIADSLTVFYDTYANPLWTKDERGFIHYQAFDVTTGGIVQTIGDFNTGTPDQPTPPAGWITPSGGGLNLITDIASDTQGRPTQLLGPWHTIDMAGIATSIRRATWMIYQDGLFQTWVAHGYATLGSSSSSSSSHSSGSSSSSGSPAYSYTLINPVSIAITDEIGRLIERIQAIRSYTAGPLVSTDAFPQSSYCRWSTNQYSDCCKLASTRQYFSIPASGTGSQGVNYNEADFGYDFLNRRNRVVAPGGTIMRTVFDARDLPISAWVGTNDRGATWSDPTGGGAPGNNMVQVAGNMYDGGLPSGDGNLTTVIQYVDSSTTRVTIFTYDWRNRRVQVTAAQDWYQVTTIDNLNRGTQVKEYAQSNANLIRRRQTLWDDRSRVYQSIRYAVDPSTGNAGNSLVDNTWYDGSSSVIMSLPAGSNAFTKSAYDGIRRRTIEYFAYYLGTITYTEAASVANDTVVEQTETSFDAANNVIQTTFRQRFHSATGTGPLTYPGGTQPQARVTYVATYPDALGRAQAEANFGTNGDTGLVRPSTIPPSSDNVLVTRTYFNSRGEAYQSFDPAGTLTCFTFDDAGRRTEQVLNCTAASSSSSSSSSSSFSSSASSGTLPTSDDKNSTTLWTYTADSLVATITAVNAETGNQTTTSLYGTTLPSSDVARNDVLAGVIYPDGGQISYLVNRLGEAKQFMDQRGVVHQYLFDLLGRQINDLVASLGGSSSSSSSGSSSSSSGIPRVDSTVQRIAHTYEVRGLLQNTTSYSSPIIGQGIVVNDVERIYNSFEQLITEYQEHNGAVNTSTSANAQYQYVNGSSNTIRPTALVYPSGRVLTYNYGASGAIDDALSRVASLIDNDGVTHLADYTRIGAATFVQQSSPQPQIAWSLINGTGIDPYTGLDQFNRVIDNRWYSTATGGDLDRIQHGYDRASNRRWRRNTVAEAVSANLDELYAIDGLYRLVELQRGQLNGANNAIVSGTLTFAQAWGLDATGNWQHFWQNDTGTSWNLQQNRVATNANEIVSISGGGWTQPIYDAAGNIVEAPQPSSPSTANALTFDAWNRMMSASASGSPIQQNLYDGDNRRVSKLVGGVLRNYYFSTDWQPLEERLNASLSADRQFVWGLRYIDDLVLRDRTSERFYPLHDPNWNVTAICTSSGVVSERYAFTAYGQPAFLSPSFTRLASSSYDWETLFSSYRWDSDIGQYAVRRRHLHSGLGRWNQRDPVRFADTVNLYEYVLARPLTDVDPSGECPWCLLGLFLIPVIIGCGGGGPRPVPVPKGGWCGTFTVKAVKAKHNPDNPNEPSVNGYQIDFDSTGCTCNSIKLVQAVTSGGLGAAPHFDCEESDFTRPIGNPNIPKGTKYPGYCQAGGRPSGGPHGGFIDAPDPGARGTKTMVVICAVCDDTTILGCVNMVIPSDGKFQIGNKPWPGIGGQVTVPAEGPGTIWEESQVKFTKDCKRHGWTPQYKNM